MIRFLLLAVLFSLVLRSLERWVGARTPRQSGPQQSKAKSAVETLVLCAGCGAYHPVSRSLARGGEQFCCEECSRRRTEVS